MTSMWGFIQQVRKEPHENLGFTMIVAGGVLAFILTPCILALQVLLWLKHGHWVKISTETLIGLLGLRRPITSWIGFQEIIDRLLSWPMTGWTLAIGVLVMIIGFETVDAGEHRVKIRKGMS